MMDTPPASPGDLLCEGRINPEDMATVSPELSWSFSDADLGDIQSAYQLTVGLTSGGSDVWDSGKVQSGEGSLKYEGTALNYGTTYYWQVRVWDNHNSTSSYSTSQYYMIDNPPEAPSSPLCEGQANPNGIMTSTPMLSWTYGDNDSGDIQSAYQLRVGVTPGSSEVWDSGKVESKEGRAKYEGLALNDGTTYYWQARVWDNHGSTSAYCVAQSFSINAGPLSPLFPLCQNRTNPGDITTSTPTFSWTFNDTDIEDIQSAYQVIAGTYQGGSEFFDSGKVEGGEGSAKYEGTALNYGTTYYWQVRTWDNHDDVSPYCASQEFRINTPPGIPGTLLCEARINPEDIITDTPVFSWQFADSDADDNQAAYQLIVGRTPGAGDKWNSGKVNSSSSTAKYNGASLSCRTTYYWQIRVWDNHGIVSSYSGVQQLMIDTPAEMPGTLRCEGRINPADITTLTPTLSWTFNDADSGDSQGAYQLTVGFSSGSSGVWDSGKVGSEDGSVKYEGPALNYGITYYWQVRVWDNHGLTGAYCASQYFRANIPPAVPSGLVCEGRQNPVGITVATPTLSWTFCDADSGDNQSAYQLTVGLTDGNSDVWDSGRIEDGAGSTKYGGQALNYGTTYYWQVRVWDNHGSTSDFSTSQFFRLDTPATAPLDPRCESRANPADITTLSPRFSWVFNDADSGDIQSDIE
jgi:hypothetical protein